MTDAAAPDRDTLGSLTDAHLKLLETWSGTPEQAQQAHALRRRLQHVGRNLLDPAQRDAAQTLLDYWASRIAGCEGEPYPEVLRLAPFDEAAADALAAHADAVWNALPEADRLIASRLFQAFHQIDAGRVTTRRLDAHDLARLFDEADWRRVAQPFIAAGVLGRSRPAGSDRDVLDLATPSLSEHWDELKTWLALRRQRVGARLLRLGAAELWMARDRKPDNLLRGTALLAALRAQIEDRDLDALDAARGGEEAVRLHWEHVSLIDDWLREGQRHEFAVRGGLIGASTVAALVLAALAGGVIFFGSRVGLAETRAVEAKTQAVEAKTQAGQALAKAENAQRTLDDVVRAEDLQTGAPSLEQLPVAAAVTPTGPPLSVGPQGCIWIGGERSSRLGDPRTGRILAPATAAQGQPYRILGNTFLRARCPGPDYSFGESRGMVSQGRLIVADAPPARFERAVDPGFWLPVHVTPRVYIQYHGKDVSRLAPLRDGLGRAGFDIPPAEALATARDMLQVRYFKAEDAPAAERLAQRLATDLIGRDGQDVAIRCFRSGVKTEQIGVLEVWLDLDRIALRDAGPNAAPTSGADLLCKS